MSNRKQQIAHLKRQIAQLQRMEADDQTQAFIEWCKEHFGYMPAVGDPIEFTTFCWPQVTPEDGNPNPLSYGTRYKVRAVVTDTTPEDGGFVSGVYTDLNHVTPGVWRRRTPGLALNVIYHGAEHASEKQFKARVGDFQCDEGETVFFTKTTLKKCRLGNTGD